MIYVTWQPAIAESGYYFLTVVNSNGLELAIDQIMDLAHGIEELEADSYDICSILAINGDSSVTVIY
jgi:hypothetical protein